MRGGKILGRWIGCSDIMVDGCGGNSSLAVLTFLDGHITFFVRVSEIHT